MDDRNTIPGDRLILLTTDLLDVSITVQPRSLDRFDLRGQILPLVGVDPELCSIELISDEGEKRIAESDDLGFFEFQELAPRCTYRLIVTGDGFAITMPEQIGYKGKSD